MDYRRDIVSIESGIFADCRMRVDELLTGTLTQMTERGISAGTVSLKIDVELHKRELGYGEVCFVPQFEWKAGSSMKLERKDAGLCTNMSEGALEYDARRGLFVLRATQETLFDEVPDAQLEDE